MLIARLNIRLCHFGEALNQHARGSLPQLTPRVTRQVKANKWVVQLRFRVLFSLCEIRAVALGRGVEPACERKSSSVDPLSDSVFVARGRSDVRYKLGDELCSFGSVLCFFV